MSCWRLLVQKILNKFLSTIEQTMSDELKEGQIFHSRYEILGVLGTGGIGTVYKARQFDIERIVALKILHSFAAQDEEFAARFIREAKALNKLCHANIVTVFGIGISDTQPYLVMELVIGKSGRQILNEIDRLPSLRALKIVYDVARALDFVHQQGIVHRDLKPENLVLTDKPEADTVKLIDFGLARVTNNSNQSLTQTGELLGTASYMSPEQSQGLKVDRRSDIYSLGACLYEFLTGQKPYVADTAIGLMYQHLHKPAPLIKAAEVDRFSDSLNKLISISMEKNPDKRFQTMAEFADAIKDVLAELKDVEEKRPQKIKTMGFAAFIAVAGIALFVTGFCALKLSKSNSSPTLEKTDQIPTNKESFDLASKRVVTLLKDSERHGPTTEGIRQAEQAYSIAKSYSDKRPEMLFVCSRFLATHYYSRRENEKVIEVLKPFSSLSLTHRLPTGVTLQNLLLSKALAGKAYLDLGNVEKARRLAREVALSSETLNDPMAIFAFDVLLNQSENNAAETMIAKATSVDLLCALSSHARELRQLHFSDLCIEKAKLLQSEPSFEVQVEAAMVLAAHGGVGTKLAADQLKQMSNLKLSDQQRKILKIAQEVVRKESKS